MLDRVAGSSWEAPVHEEGSMRSPFDEYGAGEGPTRWRVEAADALHLEGEDLAAAVSPGAAFPSALWSIVRALPGHVDTLVDIGAGGAGASEFLRRCTGATVHAVEPSAPARYAAQQCFPELLVSPGVASDTGLADACADVVTLCGVTSLIAEIEPVLAEVVRLLKPSGALGVADLFSTRVDELHTGPNVFRSWEAWGRAMEAYGFEVIEVGAGVAAPSGDWGEIADVVEDWIRRNCRHRPKFEMWLRDRRHLRRLIDGGEVVAGCLVGVRRNPTAG